MAQDDLKEIIWQVVASIPYGRVASYGQVAQLAGLPGYARYVGTALKNLPSGTELPWHRVINAKGQISFPVDSEAYQRQKSRIEAEGITFEGDKIRLSVYGW